MKSAAVGLVVAIILFAAGAACLGEARLTRRVAIAHERLATLHYDEEDASTASNAFSRLPWPLGGAGDDMERHRATVAYWLSRYESLTERTGATGAPPPADPQLLFVSANATFRSSPTLGVDRKTAVARLDTVIQSYADVLRKDPAYTDAAFNYEYVSRLRDVIAKASPAARTTKDKKAAEKEPDVSIDLPTGPTVHG